MRTNREQIGGTLFYDLRPMKTSNGSQKGLKWLSGMFLVLFSLLFTFCSFTRWYSIQLFIIVLGGMVSHWIVRIEYREKPTIVVGS